MPYPLLSAYVENINNLRAEEGLFLLRIANDPKATYQIDYEKSRGAIGNLEEKFIEIINEDNPYYEKDKLDRIGLRRLKREMEGNRRQNV